MPDPPAAAAKLAERLLGKAANSFTFAVIESCPDKIARCAKVENGPTSGTIKISGSTAVEMAFALGTYLKKECLMSFSWAKTGGHQLIAPSTWPSLAKPMVLNKRVPYTYYENVVTVSYSQWNWDWDRWAREIDWMALTGVNLCLAFTGQEEVYRKVYTGLGMNDTQLQNFFDGPAFLAWSRGQGMSGVGGPLPRKFMAKQWALNKKIVSRQKELGIGSILPQFQGG
jgi:alpha-N-acetylglucosaminidase